MIDWLLLPLRILLSFVIAVPWLLGWILGFPAVALGLLFCDFNDDHMPWPFWPWDSYAGINGTLGGANPNWPIICGGFLQTHAYKNRWIFLAWRNPCANIGGRLLAAPPGPQGLRLIYSGWLIEYWISGGFWLINLFHGRIRLGWKLADRGQFMFRFSPKGFS